MYCKYVLHNIIVIYLMLYTDVARRRRRRIIPYSLHPSPCWSILLRWPTRCYVAPCQLSSKSCRGSPLERPTLMCMALTEAMLAEVVRATSIFEWQQQRRPRSCPGSPPATDTPSQHTLPHRSPPAPTVDSPRNADAIMHDVEDGCYGPAQCLWWERQRRS